MLIKYIIYMTMVLSNGVVMKIMEAIIPHEELNKVQFSLAKGYESTVDSEIGNMVYVLDVILCLNIQLLETG